MISSLLPRIGQSGHLELAMQKRTLKQGIRDCLCLSLLVYTLFIECTLEGLSFTNELFA